MPLEAVLRGIDAAFEKWRSKKTKVRQVNSVAYCAQAVQEEAEAMAKGGALRRHEPVKPPFELDELTRYLSANAATLRTKHEAFGEIATSLEKIASEAESHYANLEQLEQRLTVLEEKMSAIAKTTQSEEAMLQPASNWTCHCVHTGEKCLQSNWRCWKSSFSSATCWKSRHCLD